MPRDQLVFDGVPCLPVEVQPLQPSSSPPATRHIPSPSHNADGPEMRGTSDRTLPSSGNRQPLPKRCPASWCMALNLFLRENVVHLLVVWTLAVIQAVACFAFGTPLLCVPGFIVCLAATWLRWRTKVEWCLCDRDLKGAVVVITGANSGLGRELTLQLIDKGAHVLMLCRDVKRGSEALQEVTSASKGKSGKASLVECDLSSSRSVIAAAQVVRSWTSSIDAIVNNAGVVMCERTVTADGEELQWATNHLGHALLTLLLLPSLSSSQIFRPVIVNVSSTVYKWGRVDWDDLRMERHYSPFASYARSKLANVMFTRALAKRCPEVTVVAVHPGAAQTQAGRHLSSFLPPCLLLLLRLLGPFFIRSAAAANQTTLHCLCSPDVHLLSGCYLSNCRPFHVSGTAGDDDECDKLWEVTCSTLNLRPYIPEDAVHSLDKSPEPSDQDMLIIIPN